MDKNIFKLRKEALLKKYIKNGYDSFNESELLELLLSYCNCSQDCSSAILNEFGNINAAFDANLINLAEFEEMNLKSAVLLKLIPNISRIYQMTSYKIKCLDTSNSAKKFFEHYFTGVLSENFAVVCVDNNMNIISTDTLSSGNREHVYTESKEIVNIAIKNKSNLIFISHNHKGSAEPSHSDYISTDKLSKSLEFFGIHIIDHIIVGSKNSISMRELPYNLKFKEYDCSDMYRKN